MSETILNKNYNGKVLCFGELLFRIGLDAEGNWLNNNHVPFYMGGAELNVATALALWGTPAKYITSLPDNHMSSQIINHFEDKGIDASGTYYHGDRIGLYLLTKGADLKNNSLIYDRANSSFSELKPGMINWEKVLDGVSWFHFSAICPAINQNIADVCEEALKVASEKNITISIDLNYRSKLWQYGKIPVQVMPTLVNYCDLIMGNIWASQIMLGTPVNSEIHTIGKKENYLQEGSKVSEYIFSSFPKCKAVANTFRFDANDDAITYYTSLHTKNHYYYTRDHSAKKIVNKVGSGDCFMAGLIYGFYNKLAPDETLNFATTAAFEKLFIEADTTSTTVDDIKKAMQND